MQTRPPVVAIMGHIDHGKSSLLDYIRKSNITAKEAGGITQHIGAYEITHTTAEGRLEKITFLDTPGHEAFSGIRSRGASTADIAVLVVSAEDGVKPQTVEALRMIREANTPMIVAITKIDKPSADIDRTKQTLAEADVYVEGFGGNVSVVNVSAKTGEGIPEFLDTLLLTASLEELTGDEEVLGSGVIIESKKDPKRGIVATGIIKNGVVRRSLFAASSNAVAPLRFILDAEGNQVEELTFSSPIQIAGWDELPKVGAEFRTFLKKDEAAAYAADSGTKLEDSGATQLTEGQILLPLIIKADAAGSLEAVKGEIAKLARERIVPKVILDGIGAVNENDVKLALTGSGAHLFGFNVKVDSPAAGLAERQGLNIEIFNIIYELKDRVAALLEEKEPRITVDEVTGSAKVLKTFSATKDKQVIGCRAVTGVIVKNAGVKIVRRESEIGRGKIRELQQGKVATDSILEGNEFGAMVESKLEIAPGDMLEIVTSVTK